MSEVKTITDIQEEAYQRGWDAHGTHIKHLLQEHGKKISQTIRARKQHQHDITKCHECYLVFQDGWNKVKESAISDAERRFNKTERQG